MFNTWSQDVDWFHSANILGGINYDPPLEEELSSYFETCTPL